MEKQIICDAFTKMIESIVEQEVASKTTAVTLESVTDFIKNSNSKEELNAIFESLLNSETGFDVVDDYYNERVNDDSELINKEDLTVDDVDGAGLLEDCYNQYIDDCYDLKDVVKDLIDRL